MRPALLVLLATSLAVRTTAQDAAAGRATYEWICMACHGPEAEGQQALHAPSLRLQEDWYLQAQLEKFRAGARGAHRDDTTGSPMRLTATVLDDDKIRDVVAYVVSLGHKGLPPTQHSLAGDATRGQTLYATCAACHGADGRGNPALRAPGLAGQWDWYLARQLHKFRSGVRGSDPRDVYGAQMAPFAKSLPDDEAIVDVIAYLRTLPPPQPEKPPAAADLDHGAREFQLCASCHGDQGQGNTAFHAPALGAQGNWYVVRQLQNFRRGVRGGEPSDVFGTQMRALLANVDDQTILDLAAHVAALPPRARTEGLTVVGADLALGKQIHVKTCSPCHGKAGEGNRVLSAPALAGQDAAYLVRQLDAFRRGLRGADLRDPPGRIMRAWSASLADEHEVHSVAAYLAGLEPVRADDHATPDKAVVALAGTPPPIGPDPTAPRVWPKGLLSPKKDQPGDAKPTTSTSPTPLPVESTPAQPVATLEVPPPDAPPTGASLFATCVGCHGTGAQGNEKLHAPVLAGLGSWYVGEQLKKFRAGWRGAHPMDTGGSSMRPMAATLPDEDAIRMVAEHIGSLPIPEPDAPRLRGNAARGASLYAACAGCHGMEGKGNEGLKAPPLLYQADWYLATQLRNFKSGARGAHPADMAGAMMRPMAAGLADEAAIADVVAHVVTLRGGTPPPAETGAETGADTVAEPTAEAGAETPAEGAADETAVATGDAPVGDAARGQALFATCIACHGIDGKGNAALQAPQIAGQESWYLVTQLRNFKNGIRGAHPQDVQGMQMRPMAMTLADEQAMADVAAHARSLAPGEGTITLDGDPQKGQQLYTTCIACHGMDAMGNAALKAPSLAGQQDWYLVRQLSNFRNGVRGAHEQDTAGATMRPMAATLPDEQALRDIAAWLTTRPAPKVQADAPAEEPAPEPAAGETEPTAADETSANEAPTGDATKGQTLFATCMACHGQDGRGNEALQAPQLAGQEAWYLSTQLRNFKNGVRGAHPQDVKGMQMRPMAMMLSDDQAIADVSAYLHGLQPGVGKVTLGGDATKGQSLYTSCIACHGMDAKGNTALKAPSLAGQEDWYLARQLLNFRTGIRGAHPDDAAGALMRPMAATLADEVAIHDVAAYLTTMGRADDAGGEPKAPDAPKEENAKEPESPKKENEPKKEND